MFQERKCNLNIATSSFKAPPFTTIPKIVQNRPPPPFSQRKLLKTIMEIQFKKFIEIPKQLHINLPLIEAFQQMTNCEKFFKDIIKNRRSLWEFKTLVMTRECNRMLWHRILSKFKNPWNFIIPYFIGGMYCGRTLCDLRANINIIPKSIFKKLWIGKVKSTTMNMQLLKDLWCILKDELMMLRLKFDNFVLLTSLAYLIFKPTMIFTYFHEGLYWPKE